MGINWTLPERMSGISVQLVDAATKQPFKEHYKDGKTYVEAEPKAEYFIKLQITQNNLSTLSASQSSPMLFVKCEVDGVDLAYASWGTFKEPAYRGCWRLSNGVETMTALRFGKVSVLNNGAKPVDISSGLVGSVTVNIYEAIDDGVKHQKDFDMQPGLSLKVNAPLAEGGLKNKTLRTEIGDYAQVRTIGNSYKTYRGGKFLESITLHYATALGLIHAGVLPKPPLWAQARLRAPAKDDEIDPELVGIQPTIIRDDSLAAFGAKSKEYECFDLTHLATDED